MVLLLQTSDVQDSDVSGDKNDTTENDQEKLSASTAVSTSEKNEGEGSHIQTQPKASKTKAAADLKRRGGPLTAQDYLKAGKHSARLNLMVCKVI